jgi:hypothetical protein
MSQSIADTYIIIETGDYMYIRNNGVINDLAMKAKDGDTQAFNDLYTTLLPHFNDIVNNYFIRNKLTTFHLDKDDYLSTVGQSLWESLKDYDSSKGNIYSRLIVFSSYRMSALTTLLLADKRHDKESSTVSLDDVLDYTDIECVDSNDFLLHSAIAHFIDKHKDGELINIFITTGNIRDRTEAFKNYFGGTYGDRERKKVQRVKDALKTHLLRQGVSI